MSPIGHKETTMPTATLTPESRILSLKNVLGRVPISRTTLWRMEREGTFPKHVQVSINRIGWFESDVEKWISEKKTP
jgi:prophage regulatory protein